MLKKKFPQTFPKKPFSTSPKKLWTSKFEIFWINLAKKENRRGEIILELVKTKKDILFFPPPPSCIGGVSHPQSHLWGLRPQATVALDCGGLVVLIRNWFAVLARNRPKFIFLLFFFLFLIRSIGEVENLFF